MSVTISGTTGVATPGVQNSGDETITGNLTVGGNATITGTLTVAGNPQQLPIGQGQTWQNVKTTPGRVAGTTYTNSTGRTIVAAISFLSASSFTASIDGVQVGEGGGSSAVRGQITLIIPAGSTYIISGTVTIDAWAELR